MMFPVDIKLALDAMKTSRWRSFLTMLGVIIGVTSVVTIVSIGEGVRSEVVGQIRSLGTDLITIKPGKGVVRDAEGNILRINLLETLGGGTTFSNTELEVVKETAGLGTVVPLSLVTAVASVDDREFTDGLIIGTSEDMPRALRQEVLYGGFFLDQDANRNVAVLGKDAADQLFQDNAPIGRAMQIHGQTFIVSGVFDEFSTSPLTPGNNYNSAIFIPYDSATAINNGQAQIQQILVRPENPSLTEQVSEVLAERLRDARAGQEDFTILREEDNLAISNTILTLITALISGVAAISLVVGGVGIMNIMLVSVSERTHEIGIRKAVGATTFQIMRQFIVEAALLSFVGGVLGVLFSLVANYFIRLMTPLSPILDVKVAGIAVLVALAVGVFFGVAPALKAARKDPIDALRQV